MKDITTGAINNSLIWWKENGKRYPTVAKLARRILCIPATSAPSERVFSTAGLTVTKLRNRMSPNNADMCVFLHDFMKVRDTLANKV